MYFLAVREVAHFLHLVRARSVFTEAGHKPCLQTTRPLVSARVLDRDHRFALRCLITILCASLVALVCPWTSKVTSWFSEPPSAVGWHRLALHHSFFLSRSTRPYIDPTDTT